MCWWIIAIVLLVLELTAPAAFFLWIGVAAGINGLLLMFFPAMDWQVQVLVFSLISVVLVLLSRRYFHNRSIETSLPNLNRRGEQYVGRKFVLIEAIINGKGKISVEDTRWSVRGPDLPVGTQVRVVVSDGSVFEVEPLGD